MMTISTKEIMEKIRGIIQDPGSKEVLTQYLTENPEYGELFIDISTQELGLVANRMAAVILIQKRKQLK